MNDRGAIDPSSWVRRRCSRPAQKQASHTTRGRKEGDEFVKGKGPGPGSPACSPRGPRNLPKRRFILLRRASGQPMSTKGYREGRPGRKVTSGISSCVVVTRGWRDEDTPQNANGRKSSERNTTIGRQNSKR